MATVQDILIAQGRTAGNTKRQNAAGWSNLIPQLAQIPGAIMNDRAAARNAQAQALSDAEDRAIVNDGRRLGNEKTADEIARARAKDEEDERYDGLMSTLMQSPGLLDKDGRIDPQKALQFARENGAEDLTLRVQTFAQRWNQSSDEARKAALEAAKASQPEAKKTRQVEVRNPDGSTTIQVVEDVPGQSFSSAPTPKPMREVVVRGPNGRPVKKLVSEAELMAGVEQYQEPKAPGAAEPLVAIAGPDGKPVYVPRSQAVGKTPASTSNKPASGLEKRALNFFNRARQADIDLEGLEETVQSMGIGGQARMAFAPNVMQSEVGQQYTQAQRAFTEARLRKDSGAAIPEQEFANDRRTYFAQPGDSKDTLAQKRRARAAVLASLGFESGQALGEFIGDADEARSIVDSYKQRADKASGGQSDAKPTNKPRFELLP